MNTVNLTDIMELDDRVVFNLLVTEFCNFACDHCFYFSGPSRPSKYMEQDVLDRLAVYLETFREVFGYNDDIYFHSDVNIVGGESTTNIKKLRKIIEENIDTWFEYGTVETTTNGSWLERKPKQTIAVLDLYRFMVEKSVDYGQDELAFIRISSDKYHDPFYKHNHGGRTGDKYLKSLLDEWIEGYSTYCTCGEQLEFDEEIEDDVCPTCGANYEYAYYGDLSEKIYVEEQKYSDKYIPTGRAGHLLGAGSQTINLTCTANSHENVITILPDGSVTDMCCRGSKFTGNILTTSPFHLLYGWRELKQYMGDLSCSTCNSQTETAINERDFDKLFSEPLFLEDIGVIIYPDCTVEEMELEYA